MYIIVHEFSRFQITKTSLLQQLSRQVRSNESWWTAWDKLTKDRVVLDLLLGGNDLFGGVLDVGSFVIIWREKEWIMRN